MSITKELFGQVYDTPVYAYTLKNASHTSMRVMDFGGTLLNVWVADASGCVDDVICGYDTPQGYITGGGYHSAIIGRCGNRIGNSTFSLDGTEYRLNGNEGKHHLHGGLRGFDRHFWQVVEAGTEEEPALILSRISPDGEENYPGNLQITVTYTLTADGALRIHYSAVTDKATPVNLTNHAYFNLSGYQRGNIGSHYLWMDADRINGIDHELIPDGSILPVDGTAYDFRETRLLGDALSDPHPEIRFFDGFDNNFIFADYDKTMKKQATLKDPASGRTMHVYTDQPCMQIYTCNIIAKDALNFKGGVEPKKYFAICLETQAMPDSINHPGFTNVVLRPGEVYDTTTVYEFVNE